MERLFPLVRGLAGAGTVATVGRMERGSDTTDLQDATPWLDALMGVAQTPKA